jgi:hypothetical protein
MTTAHRLVTRPNVLVGRRIGPPATDLPIPFVEPVQFTEPAPAEEPAPVAEAVSTPSCSACENIGPALARIEDVLNSLLLDLEHLRTRVEDALAPADLD